MPTGPKTDTDEAFNKAASKISTQVVLKLVALLLLLTTACLLVVGSSSMMTSGMFPPKGNLRPSVEEVQANGRSDIVLIRGDYLLYITCLKEEGNTCRDTKENSNAHPDICADEEENLHILFSSSGRIEDYETGWDIAYVTVSKDLKVGPIEVLVSSIQNEWLPHWESPGFGESRCSKFTFKLVFENERVAFTYNFKTQKVEGSDTPPDCLFGYQLFEVQRREISTKLFACADKLLVAWPMEDGMMVSPITNEGVVRISERFDAYLPKDTIRLQLIEIPSK